MTQYHPKKGHGVKGAKAGHAVWYLKGACKDYDNEPSGLKICEENKSGKQHGVGLSTSKGIKNANFIVFPGKDLFFYGTKKNDDIFNIEKKQKIIQHISDIKIFQHLQFHDFMFSEQLIDKKNKIQSFSNYALGSDYAINLARNLYCIYIPINRPVLEAIINELNDLNNSYKNSIGTSYRGLIFSSRKEDNLFHWSGIFDNCVHTPRSILGLLGIMREKKKNQTFFKQLNHIPVPSNTVIDIHRSVNKQKIKFKDFWKNKQKRLMVNQYQWISIGHGSLVEKIPIHENNLIFNNSDKMFVRTSLFEERSHLLRHLHQKNKYSYHIGIAENFYHNFAHFKQKYLLAKKDIEKDKKSGKYYKCKKKHSQNTHKCQDFIKFLDNFESIIDQKTTDLDSIKKPT